MEQEKQNIEIIQEFETINLGSIDEVVEFLGNIAGLENTFVKNVVYPKLYESGYITLDEKNKNITTTEKNKYTFTKENIDSYFDCKSPFEKESYVILNNEISDIIFSIEYIVNCEDLNSAGLYIIARAMQDIKDKGFVQIFTLYYIDMYNQRKMEEIPKR